MIVIGDVHGKFQEYEALCKFFPDKTTIQLGDMGVGFPDGRCPTFGPRDFFFRGNHDNPRAAKHFANNLGDGGLLDLAEKSIFYIPGAWSIDWSRRQEGVSWWRDEELSIPELAALIEEFIEAKPDLVISHDAPNDASFALLNRLTLDTTLHHVFPTRTGQALQAMFEAHQPAQWIFGHYHVDWAREIKGTKFRCLNELSWMEV